MAESPYKQKMVTAVNDSDGYHGGQILRNGASLSCLLNIPVRVDKIRAGRSNPGLRPQHLSGLELLRDVSRGKLERGGVGSTEVALYPGLISSGSYLADTKTAGSVCLLLQAALPCVCFANGPTEILLKGGTNAEMAPQIDYFSMVFQPMAVHFGIKYDCQIQKRGYFPKGGGEVLLKASPVSNIQPVQFIDKGTVVKINGRSFVAGTLPIKVAYIMSQVATDLIKSQHPDVTVNIEVVKEPQHLAVGNGSGIIIVAETSTGCKLAGSALGKRGVQAEEVGQSAAEELLFNISHGGCVDQHLQDQLIIFMAIACGKSVVKCGPLTDHTKTAIHVAELITRAKFNIQKITETENRIECDGIGLTNQYL